MSGQTQKILAATNKKGEFHYYLKVPVMGFELKAEEVSLEDDILEELQALGYIE
ncbi:hypothetical protein ACFLU6_10135 [Acidobacteriota bacterium]